MWIFLVGGLVMPSKANLKTADPAFTEGIYDLQVRGRTTQHLRRFMKDYMEEGTYHNEIQLTPSRDYNCRFYTTHEAFSNAVVRAVADIDYEKFKPTVETRDADGKYRYGTSAEVHTYHGVLNAIWGAVCRLGQPGGIYGPKSLDNPEGYGSVQTLTDDDRNPSAFIDHDADSDMDWTPNKETILEDLLEEMKDIPASQWEDYLTESEVELVRPVIELAVTNEKALNDAIEAVKTAQKA